MLAVLAPTPGRTFIGPSGTTYLADVNGIIGNVLTGADLNALLAAGCIQLQPSYSFLGRLLQANFNLTSDQQISLLFLPASARFRVTKITVENTTVNGMSTAVGGIYPATGKTGTALVAASQAYTGLTNANTALDLTLATPNAIQPAGTPLYFSLTTPQGAAALADVNVYGDVYV